MPPERKPEWLRVRLPSGEKYVELRRKITKRGLHTVCDEARCPNVAECWGELGTATIMLMGDICTRACRFCAVTSGKPLALDPEEPERVAESISDIGLRYVVLTSVCRDDLEDGGASHFAETVSAIKHTSRGTRIEVLVPDFGGVPDDLSKIVRSRPDVIGHNLETVERLAGKLRDRRSSYRLSLDVLSRFHAHARDSLTKSSLMLGLGETEGEILTSIKDLRHVGVDILTLGQYLRPSRAHHPVVEYIRPERFDELKEIALGFGFSYVASGPLVRSSYHALEAVLH